MYKIQVQIPNDPKLSKWEDLVDMPDFPAVEDAQKWMGENHIYLLMEVGLSFQIVPVSED